MQMRYLDLEMMYTLGGKKMNRSHNIIVKIGVAIALVALSFSCHSPRMIKAKIRQSPVLELYTKIAYNREKELLLRMPSKGYVYYEKYYGIEIGKWKRKEDSLFLYPKMHINDNLNNCEKVDNVLYFGNPSFGKSPIPFRLYIYTDKNNITERTVEHFHLEEMFDGEDDSFWHEIHAPLTRRKIKATKIEKSVMTARWLYGERFFDCD